MESPETKQLENWSSFKKLNIDSMIFLLLLNTSLGPNAFWSISLI